MSSCSILLISRLKLIEIERNIEVLIICRNEQLILKKLLLRFIGNELVLFSLQIELKLECLHGLLLFPG